MRASSALVLALALAAILVSCGDDKRAAIVPPRDSGSARAACLELPNVLPRPPRDGLPCELLPPGLNL